MTWLWSSFFISLSNLDSTTLCGIITICVPTKLSIIASLRAYILIRVQAIINNSPYIHYFIKPSPKIILKNNIEILRIIISGKFFVFVFIFKSVIKIQIWHDKNTNDVRKKLSINLIVLTATQGGRKHIKYDKSLPNN